MTDALTDSTIQKHRHIYMYDDERVVDALIALRDAEGQDWWHLVVELEDGRYAAARLSDLEKPLEKDKAAFLSYKLGDLVGPVLKPVELLVEQDATTSEEIQKRISKIQPPKPQVAIILNHGEFKGIIAVTTRGLFDSRLLNLAGHYAPIPDQGVLSPRRIKAKAKKAALEKKS